jgi:hypothetical protein
VIGGSAVLVWSTAASFAVLGTALPPLPFLAGAFGAGFFAFLVVRLVRGQPPLGLLAVPLPVLCLMVLGFLGHNGLYVTAFALCARGGGEPYLLSLAAVNGRTAGCDRNRPPDRPSNHWHAAGIRGAGLDRLARLRER